MLHYNTLITLKGTILDQNRTAWRQHWHLTENVDTGMGLLEKETADNILKCDVSHFNHGQYVAVMWQDKWVRGIVSMESLFLIWLVDYGIFMRPNENTVLINLPADYKKYPTKVFEASIHGVCPVGKALTDDCQIKNEVTTTWNTGAIEKAKALIVSARRRYFVPIAILSTKNNDVVLGDLYLQLEDKGMVNIVDELQLWPVFLERNPEVFIKNLAVNYTTRRKHRASVLKPEFPGLDIPVISLLTSLTDYQTLCATASAPLQDPTEFDSDSEDGSSLVIKANRDLENKLTPAEIEFYSRMYFTSYGIEYNVLNVLLNKLKDLRICKKYQDHDLKGLGRANSRRSRF